MVLVERGLIRIKWTLARAIRRILFRSRRLLANSRLASRHYRLWIERYGVITPVLRDQMRAEIGGWPARPLISVIMPSYNIEPKWLGQAIESVRHQIYPHWELCISDDASTLPGIRPLLERFAAEDPRIRVTFRSENGHISVNSNTALALASGEYIALAGCRRLVERGRAVLGRSRDCGASGCRFALFRRGQDQERRQALWLPISNRRGIPR